MTTTRLEAIAVGPDSDLADQMLRRYYDELSSRLPGGFDPGQSVGVRVGELVPPHGLFLVAYLDGVPAGCGAVRQLNGTAAEVKRMWVDPAVRGRGVGKFLLASLETAAGRLGCDRMCLDTSAHLPEALALYRSQGYREVTAYNSNAYAAHWFEKELG